ncbi:hypothetical protein V8E54_005839, partial [Elaphomyces granulatus]
LILGVNRTKKEAWHRIYYLSKFGSWDSFEKDVRKAKLAIQLNDDILGYRMSSKHQHAHNFSDEQLVCGDEASVQARFQSNVGHVMTTIYQSLNINARF